MSDPQVRKSLVGRWALQGCVGRSGSKAMHPLGANPLGMLVYTRQSMIVFISASERRQFSTEDIRAIPAAEVIADFATFETYFGRYQIDTRRSIVTHVVESSKIPNHIGRELCRHFRLTSDTLVLTATTELWLDGVPWIFELGWKKQESFP